MTPRSVADAAAEVEDAAAVKEVLAALPPRQRAALVLRYYADLSIADTAFVLGCAPGTVTALCSQATARLRRLDVADPDDDTIHAEVPR